MPDDVSESELSTWTLGDIKSSGLVLEGACATTGCKEFARFDIDGLIERFGGAWRVPKTLPVSCSVCGERLMFQVAALHDDNKGT